MNIKSTIFTLCITMSLFCNVISAAERSKTGTYIWNSAKIVVGIALCVSSTSLFDKAQLPLRMASIARHDWQEFLNKTKSINLSFGQKCEQRGQKKTAEQLGNLGLTWAGGSLALVAAGLGLIIHGSKKIHQARNSA